MRKLILFFLIFGCGQSWAITTSGINSQTLPITALNVSGNISVTGNMFFSKKSATTTPFITQDSTGTLWLGQNGIYNGTNVVSQETSASSAMFFSSVGNISILNSASIASGSNLTNLSTRLRILASGNVGINSSDPQYRLSVNGNFGVTGNIYETNSAYGGYFVSGNATVTVIGSTTTLYDVTKNAQTCTVIKNMTHSGGVITVGVAGVYEVEVLGNIDQKTPGDDIHLFISKNNTSNPSWEYISDTLDSTIGSQPIACHGIFQLNANDTLRLKVQNVTGARNVGIENVNFKVTRIAP